MLLSPMDARILQLHRFLVAYEAMTAATALWQCCQLRVLFPSNYMVHFPSAIGPFGASCTLMVLLQPDWRKMSLDKDIKVLVAFSEQKCPVSNLKIGVKIRQSRCI